MFAEFFKGMVPKSVSLTTLKKGLEKISDLGDSQNFASQSESYLDRSAVKADLISGNRLIEVKRANKRRKSAEEVDSVSARQMIVSWSSFALVVLMLALGTFTDRGKVVFSQINGSVGELCDETALFLSPNQTKGQNQIGFQIPLENAIPVSLDSQSTDR